MKIEIQLSKLPKWSKIKRVPKSNRHLVHGYCWNDERDRLEFHAGIGNVTKWFKKEDVVDTSEASS